MSTIPPPTDQFQLPLILRCCGYRSRRVGRWVGFCLELNIWEEGRDWDELLERLVLAAAHRLAKLQGAGEPLPGKAPLRMRLLYTWVALLHFIRPQGERCLADLSSGLLTQFPAH